MIEVHLEEMPGDQESATVIYWHVEEGDRVEEGDDLVKLSVDGKTFDCSAPAAGIVNDIYFEEGEEVRRGEVLATIEELNGEPGARLEDTL